jgi:hypothetical protein
MAISDRTLRNLRNLGHQKSPRMVIGHGIPNNRDGNEGEFRLHSTANGIRLYVKYARKWIGFAPETETNHIIQLNDDNSLVDEGSITFPNGFILKWGYTSASATSKDIVFPSAFKHKCVSVFLSYHDSGHTGGMVTNGPELKYLPSTTGFSVSMATDGDTLYWLAIGN